MRASTSSRFDFAWADRIDDVDAEEWDSCVSDGNPFVAHAYLSALETSGAACPSLGWRPRHLLMRDGAGRLAGAAPVYVKAHSEAEIGSDFGWSVAHDRAVGPYYPKLQAEVPTTPFPGPRLLVGEGPDADLLRRELLDRLIEETEDLGMSSLHFVFVSKDDWRAMEDRGLLCDFGIRFRWRNRGWSTFDEFLGDLNSRRRGMVRKERRAVGRSGLDCVRVEGDDITPDLLDAFIPLYLATYEKYATRPPLNAEFFRRLHKAMGDQMLFNVALKDGEVAAATMFLRGGDLLAAQHWGARISQPFLHYELTYYMGIEYAIERGLEHFDAGPVGNHKSNRGLLATPSLNAHWFRDRDFARMLAPGVVRRSEAVRARALDLHSRSAVSHAADEVFVRAGV